MQKRVGTQPADDQRYSAGEWKNVEVGTGRGLRMENSVTEKKQEWKTWRILSDNTNWHREWERRDNKTAVETMENKWEWLGKLEGTEW